ncbi:hypothetical protein [Achromobacter agilis]|uniref:GGDEF domain-containing protein n=1 Tax=Achromobacter agilis TaxID=1353888 RepID=A0A446CU14_9BURK|nr:hypothetical protein [Achromobacter agilis]SSW71348.1 hypothetical protein AGI3411_05108 [Achromobacter agilis]
MLSPDGINRLYTFATIEGTPLILDVAMDVDEVLAPWVRRALLVVAADAAIYQAKRAGRNRVAVAGE